MPGIDLSTLTAPELQQLRRLARGRHDGLLIDRVEWEIAQRAALSSRLGFQVGRPAPVAGGDGEVTLDEVRAFRQPELQLPPPRRASSLPALAGGLVAGSLITAAAFAGVQGLDGWRLRAKSPAVQVAVAERQAKPVRRPAPRPVATPSTSTSDAVAGALAPEPFPPQAPPPPPAPVEVAVVEAPAPAPVVAEEPPPAPVVEEVAKPEPKRALAKKDKAKPSEKKKELASKTEKPSKTVVAPKAKATPKTPAAKALAEADDPIGVLLARAERTAKGAADAAR